MGDPKTRRGDKLSSCTMSEGKLCSNQVRVSNNKHCRAEVLKRKGRFRVFCKMPSAQCHCQEQRQSEVLLNEKIARKKSRKMSSSKGLPGACIPRVISSILHAVVKFGLD